jgi:hypothetical protein
MQSAQAREPDCRSVSGLHSELEPATDLVRDSASDSEPEWLEFPLSVAQAELPAPLDSALRLPFPLPQVSFVVSDDFSLRCALNQMNRASPSLALM